MQITRVLTHFMALLIFAVAGVGCAPGFEVVSSQKMLSESGSSVLEITQEDAADILGKGFWSYLASNTSETSEFTYHDITLKVPYGKIFSPIAKRIEAFTPTVCTSLGYGVGASNYGAHEYACGTPIDNMWKNLLSLDIDEIADDQGSTQYRVPAFTTQLLLGRINRGLTYSIPSLDTRTTLSRRSSVTPGRDVALRLRPSGDTLAIDACFHLPGTSLSSPSQTLKVSGSKSVLGVRIGASTDVEIKFGEVSFDGLKNCATANLHLSSAGIPQIQSTTIEDTQIVNARLTGTSIRLKDWWARFLDSMANLFGVNIRKSLIAKAQAQVADLSDAETKNGQWISRIGSKLLGDNHISELNKLIQEELNGKSLPVTSSDIKETLKKNCQLLSIVDGELGKILVSEACASIVDKFEFHVSPFVKSEASEKNGCYAYYGFPHETKDINGNQKWWSENCVIGSRLVIGIPKINEADALKTILKKVSRIIRDIELPPALIEKLKAQKMTVEAALNRIDEAIKSGRAPRTLDDVLALL